MMDPRRFDDRFRRMVVRCVSACLSLIGLFGVAIALMIVVSGHTRYSNLDGSRLVPVVVVAAFVVFDIVAAFRHVSEVRTQARWATRMALVVVLPWAPLILVTIGCSLVSGLARRGEPRRIVPASLTSTGAAVVAALIFRESLSWSHQLAMGIHLWNGSVALGALCAISAAIALSLVAGAHQSFVPGIRQWNLLWSEQLTRALVDLLFAVLGLSAVDRAVTDFTLFPVTLGLIVGVGLLARTYRVTRLDSLTDSLTGVLSRAGFMLRAEKRVHRVGSCGVLCVADLNNFKLVNDQLGRGMGDVVLKEVARRFVRTINYGDLVGRLGGDEFGVLMLLPSGEDEREALARLGGAASGVIDIDGIPVRIDASIGVVRFPDQEGESFNTLAAKADSAMNDAKHLGRSLTVYRPGQTPARLGRLSLVAELSRAMDNEELYLDYQPRVAVESGKIVSCEALLRWAHPTLGLVPPSDFIPLAEHTEVMGPLTAYVLERSLADCAWWRSKGLEIGVSVNGSARNLGDIGWVRSLERAIRDSGVPAQLVEIEITENAIFLDPLNSLTMVKELRAMGVGVSLDDFGTGYSSLSVLRDIAITHLKIDLSFVMKLLSSRRNLEIVRSVVDLAERLGIETVAEGVESAEILDVLRDLRVGYVQGYYVSRPVVKERILQFGRERGQLVELGSEL